MDCTLGALLRGCLKERAPLPPKRVALLIEGFPRPYHPIVDFAKLLYLLRMHGAKATFVVDWQEIRERGMSSSVAEMMKLLRHNEHEVAIKFKSGLCGGAKLNQHAVEALHFLQRVYGITVVSAKVGRSLTADHGAFASLGITVVDGVRNQVVVQDTETVLLDMALALHNAREMKCVCVKEVSK
tara:strand:- start:1927 stop:2478 length:552 start_codon:yes stop_codon:yes gene_type:complete